MSKPTVGGAVAMFSALLLLVASVAQLSAQSSSVPVEEGVFEATLSPWRSMQGRLIERASFSGPAVISAYGDTPRLFAIVPAGLSLCDRSANFTAEIQPVWIGEDGQVVGRSGPIMLQVGSDRFVDAEVPFIVGGALPDTLATFVWLPAEGDRAGVVRMTVRAILPGSGGSEQRDVVFEARFRAEPWLGRVARMTGGRDFERMDAHERLAVIRAATCETQPPAAPAVQSVPAEPPGEPDDAGAPTGNANRWYQRCMQEMRVAENESRSQYRVRCDCTAKVLAESAGYLQPHERDGLAHQFWTTVDAVLARGRRPAVYIVEAACDGG